VENITYFKRFLKYKKHTKLIVTTWVTVFYHKHTQKTRTGE